MRQHNHLNIGESEESKDGYMRQCLDCGIQRRF